MCVKGRCGSCLRRTPVESFPVECCCSLHPCPCPCPCPSPYGSYLNRESFHATVYLSLNQGPCSVHCPYICKGLSSSKPFISTFTLSLHSHPKEREENKKPKQWKGGISGRKMRRKSQSSEQPASHDGRVRGWGFCGHRGWPQCWYRHNRWLSKLLHLYLYLYVCVYL